MVESINDNIITLLTGLTLKITSNDLRNNLRRVERQSVFLSLDDSAKISYILQFVDEKILEFQESLEKKKRTKSMKYEEWKKLMLDKFEKRMSKKEYLRSRQNYNESCYEYFLRMSKEGRKIIEDEEMILEIALMGLKLNKEEIELMSLEFKEISDIFLEKVQALEIIKKEAFLRRKNQRENGKIHMKEYKKDNKSVNNVDDVEEIIKDSSIYLDGQNFRLIVDTGSAYSFITNKVLCKIKRASQRMKEPLKLLTCLLEEFTVDKHINLKFEIRGKTYEHYFKIIPKRDDFVVILGRDWINSRKESKEQMHSETTEIALKRLFMEKNEGYRGNEIAEIRTKPGFKVYNYPYNIAQSMEKKVEQEIQRLLKRGYIRESKSSWLNNVKPVDKPDGSVRLTTNFVKLNDLVDLESYSLPNMEHMLRSLRNKKWFSKIDLTEGFFQIHLRETDKEKTAFRIKNRTYEWNRMPMGFKNSPATFQRIMDKVLASVIGTCCFVYVDDILIFGESEEDHDLALIKICDLLSNAGFQGNETKMEYKKEKIEFLGHIVSQNKIIFKLDPEQGLTEYKTPENVEEVRRFLGIVNVYRKYIKNCASVCEPLSKLLRKNIKFEWKNEQEKAFRSLIESILGAECLTQPDFERRFSLTTDASNKGIGAVLSQIDDEGAERPIAFASRQLRPAEFNYSITEKEMLAALWGMEHFDFYLYGREFDVYTDHKALEAWSAKGKLNSARIERWNERLQRYSCKMKYKPPQELEHADALSRGFNTTVATIENKEKSNLIIKAHEELVHRGAKATYEHLKKNYNEEDISMKEVKEVLSRCFRCKLYNPIKIAGWRYIESFSPGEKVAFDVIGPIEDNYIITGIDYFSRFAMAEVCSSKKSENILKFLKKVHFKLNVKTLVSDGARENLSKEIETWVQQNEIKRHITSSYHHNSNGRVERFNRTLGEAVRKQNMKLTLEERVRNAIRTYNDTIHNATGITPKEALEYENLSAVKQRHFNNRIEKYKKLFNKPELSKLKVKDLVLIEDNIHKVKGQPKFGSIGEIVEILDNDTYWVADSTRTIKKHITQLRKIDEEDFFL